MVKIVVFDINTAKGGMFEYPKHPPFVTSLLHFNSAQWSIKSVELQIGHYEYRIMAKDDSVDNVCPSSLHKSRLGF